MYSVETPSVDTEKLNEILKNHFHLKEFRPGQQEIIQSILQGHDLMAIIPTGGGKSLCYQIISIYKQKLIIVISPLIALMKDQVAALHKLGIPSAYLYSGQDLLEKRLIFNSLAKGGPFVLYLSPERVSKEGFSKWVKDQDITLFAVDEAHCISHWGHDFREEYNQLSLLKELRPEIPTLALTATATSAVLNDICKSLGMKNPLKMVYGFYRPNLFYQVEDCTNEDEKIHFIIKALQQFPEGRIIIYCGTRNNAEEVAYDLSQRFPKVAFYHAGLDTIKRNLIQKNYIDGKTRILVATNAFGMGIDQPDVRLVIHYNIPSDIDSLYQQMGRAGRDQINSTCLVLYSKKDKGLQSYFIESSEAERSIKNRKWRALDSLIAYLEEDRCRHLQILKYFNDTRKISRCGHCDICAPHSNRKVRFLS